MVGRVLGVKPDWAVDAGDALAAAICHLTHRRFERLAAAFPGVDARLLPSSADSLRRL